MKYSRAKKAADHEICKDNVRTLYEDNLARCNAKIATNFHGGAFGLNWLEMTMIVVTAVAWQYVVWLFHG